MVGGMKRRRILLVLAMAAVAAAVALCWPRGPKEPVFEGKRLGHCLSQALTTGTPKAQDQAERAVKAIGTNALPWLMSEFTRPYSKSSSAFNRWVQRNTRWKYRFHGDEKRMRRAAHGIHWLGSNAAPALPVLYTYFTDPVRARHAAYAMTGTGELSLPYVQQAIASTNTELARVGTLAMMQLARETETAIPHLVQLVNHKDSIVRHLTVFGLSLVKSRPDLTLPAIVSAAADADLRVRIIATNMLQNVSSDSKPAVPALRRYPG